MSRLPASLLAVATLIVGIRHGSAAEYVWIEGESPTKSPAEFRAGGWGNKHYLSGGKWLSGRTEARAWPWPTSERARPRLPSSTPCWLLCLDLLHPFRLPEAVRGRAVKNGSRHLFLLQVGDRFAQATSQHVLG